MNRLMKLRVDTSNSKHSIARILRDKSVSFADYDASLAERKALATAYIFENMPLYIGEQELIVGSRTMYDDTEDTGSNQSCYDYNCMPHYVNDKDIEYFGFNQEYVSKAHYAPDYSIALNNGLDNLIQYQKDMLDKYKLKDQKEFGHSVIIVLEGVQKLITRYSVYAKSLAKKERGNRKDELINISKVCENIAHKKASNIYEAAQLFWFMHLSILIENFQFINYGRIDQVLYPFVKDETESELKELMGCLLLKFYDQYDLILADKNLMGVYSAQHNITIGGIKPDGTDGCNKITKAILQALEVTHLPEPLISVRVSKKNPDYLLDLATTLSVNGMNCMAYYNDEDNINSLTKAGIPLERARDYGFGLCQDVLIPGYSDHYSSGAVNLTDELLKTLRDNCEKDISFKDFFELYKQNVTEVIDTNIRAYNDWETAILEYNKGNRDLYFKYIKEGKILVNEPFRGLSDAQAAAQSEGSSKKELYIPSLMSPLALTSSMYHGCIQSGYDITRVGTLGKDKGFYILGLGVAFNSLAALKEEVFRKKHYTLTEINDAVEINFENEEIMRQRLLNAPKWCNDIDDVDKDCAKIIEFASKEITKFKTPGGGFHLAGCHQPHPVFAGRHLMATPNGRLKGQPIPISLSPENGTMHNGPTAAMASCCKIDNTLMQWNSCFMLQYYSSTFDVKNGNKKFAELLKSFFSIGGLQHQPNIVDLEQLKDAQIHPENYKDLIIRMWGVSAHFVDLPKDVQDEFIARFNF